LYSQRKQYIGLMKKVIPITFILFTFGLKAQEVLHYDNQNVWLNHTLTFEFSSKYSFHSEVQWRRADWIQQPQQSLFRFGINRDFGNGLSATTGYCYVYTSQYGKIPVKSAFPENRGWIQLQQKNTRGRIEMIERLRLEQRFVHSPVLNATTNLYEAGEAIYSHRARFLQRINIALNKKSFENGTIYLALWDEFFASFGKTVPSNIFDQNRAFVGIGMQLPKVGRLELGYLNQLNNKGYSMDPANGKTLNMREQNNILSIALYTNIPYEEKKSEDKSEN